MILPALGYPIINGIQHSIQGGLGLTLIRFLPTVQYFMAQSFTMRW